MLLHVSGMARVASANGVGVAVGVNVGVGEGVSVVVGVGVEVGINVGVGVAVGVEVGFCHGNTVPWQALISALKRMKAMRYCPQARFMAISLSFFPFPHTHYTCFPLSLKVALCSCSNSEFGL